MWWLIVMYMSFFSLLEAQKYSFFYSQFLFFVLRHNIKGKLCPLLPFLCVFVFLQSQNLDRLMGLPLGQLKRNTITETLLKVLKWSEIVCVRVFLFSCIIYFWNTHTKKAWKAKEYFVKCAWIYECSFRRDFNSMWNACTISQTNWQTSCPSGKLYKGVSNLESPEVHPNFFANKYFIKVPNPSIHESKSLLILHSMIHQNELYLFLKS